MTAVAGAFGFRGAGAQGDIGEFEVILHARDVFHNIEGNQTWASISGFRSGGRQLNRLQLA